MCSPAPCHKCGKTTWAGCGAHVDAVKSSVPADRWCDGNHGGSTNSEGGFFSKLIGR